MSSATPREGRIVLASDHAGFRLKKIVAGKLEAMGLHPTDIGAYDAEPSDYVDFARKAAEMIASGDADYGILTCGTGVGMSIAAGKVPGIRVVLCGDSYTARVSREHNDANVLALAERVIGSELALEIVQVWLRTPFSGEERHVRRLDKVRRIEETYGIPVEPDHPSGKDEP